MSEVNEAVQVVMLFGRGIVLLGNITIKTAAQVMKLLNTIYLSKWEGSVSLNRLRKSRGEDLLFINVSSETAAELAAVEKEMKSHGILFARMPDLCGGDGRTQYAIPASDASRMTAMLLDHTNGEHRHIRMGPISESDYMMTGKKVDGSDTPEMGRLRRSASSRKETEEAIRRDLPKQDRSMAQAAEEMAKASIDPRIRAKALEGQGLKDQYTWLLAAPIFENKDVAQFITPDGKQTIFIRQRDILPARDEQGRRKAAIFADQVYSLLPVGKENVISADGSKAIAVFKVAGGVSVAQSAQEPDRKVGQFLPQEPIR